MCDIIGPTVRSIVLLPTILKPGRHHNSSCTITIYTITLFANLKYVKRIEIQHPGSAALTCAWRVWLEGKLPWIEHVTTPRRYGEKIAGNA